MIYKEFEDWFLEQEGYFLRCERFHESFDNFSSHDSKKANMRIWLQAAFEAGKSDIEEERVELYQMCLNQAKTIRSKQCEIDRLMLEFCPDEMTEEQLAEWKSNQRFV